MIDAGSLRDELGAAGLLAIENERLRAELQAHARDLRASRREIVATMDHARQRLERDLHDGAQQRLIALGYDLALAGAAVRDSAPATADTLRAVRDEVRRALEELRELAHGIFPAVLDESGLTPALHTLAERAPIPVELEALPGGRLPATVESAAYVTVDQVVAGAARQGATFVRVAVEPDGDGLTLVVDHDGDATPASEITSTTDRVGAVGGRLSIEAVGAVTRVRAWIPPVADGRA
jgi:signal transduction histidine kinase